MKRINQLRKYPFLLMIVISTIILTMIGLAGKNNIYSGYKIVLQSTPLLAAVFEGAGEGKYPWMMIANKDNKDMSDESQKDSGIDSGNVAEASTSGYNNKAENKDSVPDHQDISAEGSGQSNEDKHTGNSETSEDDQTEDDTIKSDNAGKAETKKDNIKDSDMGRKPEKGKGASSESNKDQQSNDKTSSSSGDKKGNSNESKDKTTDQDTSQNASSSGGRKKTEIKPYDFQTVSKKYFSDALFIGDSRTVGLSEYSDLSNSTFYADVGLTIYDIFDRKIAKVDGNKETILKALEDKQYKKIYIMLGINELGRGTTETFTDEYKKVIDRIKELQPQSIIFVEGIMNVSKEKSDADPIFNNKNIRERNNSIAKLANNENIFYIDVNDAITDKGGNLPSRYTFDNIHLKAAYYGIWTDFLLKHGVIEG
jgi:Lysophospholipase L1 and related esterases